MVAVHSGKVGRGQKEGAFEELRAHRWGWGRVGDMKGGMGVGHNGGL